MAVQRLLNVPREGYDRIIFNFPHSGAQRVHVNRELLRAFFSAAVACLNVSLGEIHVALKDRPPYTNWSLHGISVYFFMMGLRTL
jgi:hypothetical protein